MVARKHPEESNESMNNREKLESLFRIDKVVDDKYLIPLSEKTAFAIRAASLNTARKLIESGIITENKDDNDVVFFAIAIPKRYGLTNGETMQLQTGLSGKALADYFDLRADLLSTGFKDTEVDEILSNPKNYGKLDATQKRRAFTFLREAQANQNKDLSDITGVISNRLIPDWDMNDTNALPEKLINEFLVFLNKERSQWADEDEIDPKPTELLTITADVQELNAVA